MIATSHTEPDTAGRLCERLTEALSEQCLTVAEGGEGLCLAATAILSRCLEDRLGPCAKVRAVCGSYLTDAGPRSHWWVEVAALGLRLDPTRGQFDDGALTGPLGDTRYRPERDFECGWSRELVIVECERAFVYPGAARQFGSRALASLDAIEA